MPTSPYDCLKGLDFFGPREDEVLRVEDQLIVRDDFLRLLNPQDVIPATVVDSYFLIWETESLYDLEFPTRFTIVSSQVSNRIIRRRRFRRSTPSQLDVRSLFVPEMDLFEYELVLMPWYNTSNKYWILIEIRPAKNLIRLYAAPGCRKSSLHDHIFKCIVWFLDSEYCIRYPQGRRSGRWRKEIQAMLQIQGKKPCSISSKELREGCGAIMAQYCEALSVNKDLTTLSIDSDVIAETRSRMATRLIIDGNVEPFPDSFHRLRTRRRIYRRIKPLAKIWEKSQET